jgi:hypothetical protein
MYTGYLGRSVVWFLLCSICGFLAYTLLLLATVGKPDQELNGGALVRVVNLTLLKV